MNKNKIYQQSELVGDMFRSRIRELTEAKSHLDSQLEKVCELLTYYYY